jgi:hypothetical protein
MLRVLALALKGDKFTDPIDGKSFKTFLPYGYGTQRNNVLSPTFFRKTSFTLVISK